MKINCLNKISPIGLAQLKENYELTDKIADADALLVRSAVMHEMDLPKNILAVARAGAGVNNIPLKKYADQGIVVFNTPGANANGVKELFLAGMFLSARDIVGGVNWVNQNKDNENIALLIEKEKTNFAGTEVINKKIGVIGLGMIGVMVANACSDLEMEVYGYDPFLSVSNAVHLPKDTHYLSTIEKIYRECDYISLHVPLTDATKGMINKDSFALMKDGVVLLNFARDSLVNDGDLEVAIANGKVAKYVTDFPNAKTAKMKNVIAIPHLGASTEEAEDNCAKMAVYELMDYIENGNIKNAVNYPNCDAGIPTADNRITINHLNVPGMINKFTDIINNQKGNIANMINKSYKEYAYTIFDIDGADSTIIKKMIEEIDGILRVRIVK